MDKSLKLNSQAKILIYGGDYCPYCLKVKAIFDKKKKPYEYRNITQKPEYEDEREQLANQLNHHTVPMVFINQKFYGGCSDIQELEKKGKLDQLIQ